ncbi:MAG: TM1812 family CRISPR-associated protein [Campylobacteraceae bacterium]|jgi:CRISPR-associated DxTHG motif protein|nr:TM1812 family CRISPR-associated protein [Campylobacteraceae bacterium]
MKIVTILGKSNTNVKYQYDEQLQNKFQLKKSDYNNMLTLLIDNFDHEIIPIFTPEAKKVQIDVLKKEFGSDYSSIFNEKYLIEDDKNYYDILSLINDAIAENDEYIIDLTHGFRHIPILATISLITHNINNSSNIKHIFFAKEIKPRKEYEIIDLKEYLELANMSYMLASFANNYTVSKIADFADQSFADLKDNLEKLSNHLLSNSLKNISELLEETLRYINEILQNKKVLIFKHSLESIEKHVKELQALSKIEQTSKRLFEFSKLLYERGYLLNAITLLFEAIGCYCMESLIEIDTVVREYIKGFGRHYDQVQKCRSIIAKFPKSGKEGVQEKINNFLQGKNIESFQKFIEEAKNLRNNLAHGNHEEGIKDVKEKFFKLTNEYKKFCVDNDILAK